MSRMTARRRIVRLDGRGAGPARRGGEEHMAAEEPLEMRIGGVPYTVTMRTPGDDFDLVAGHLVAEGVLAGPEDLVQMKFCTAENGCTSTAYLSADSGADPDSYPILGSDPTLASDLPLFGSGDPLNIVDVTLAAGVELPEERLKRSSYVS